MLPAPDVMARTHKRKLGARKYADYTPETLLQCLNAVRAGMSHRAAEIAYKIPRKTIFNKLKQRHKYKPGYQPVFSFEEEKSFVQSIITLSNFGFPVNEFELRCIVKSYLERIGRKISRFKNNFPGVDWTKSFLKRHHELSVRLATNIKRQRAALDEECINSYIQNLKITLSEVPPTHIYNYDETNLTDNPGLKKVITKRGTKYPERICNSSKSSISLMIVGNAAGELLPPYVVYKAKSLWNTWTENGPSGARYNNTTSGWFETDTFADWFRTLLLPKLRKQDGKKVIIGDNLSSHLNDEVICLCEQNNISFVCLPPNSTHVTQPLDVAFFAPMKQAWRQILTNYKETHVGSRSAVLEKQHFPQLLLKLMDKLSENGRDNLVAGFKKCGIVPCDATPILERIKPTVVNATEAVNDTFIEFLSQKRNEATEYKIKRKKKKINVEAGKSVISEDVINANEKENIGGNNKKKYLMQIENNEDLDDIAGVTVDSEDDEGENSIENEIREMEEEHEFTNRLILGNLESNTNFREIEKEIGKYVVFKYENVKYPGIITDMRKDEVKVSAMERANAYWRWPKTKDEIWYQWSEVLGGISPPIQVTKRGFYKCQDLDKFWFE